jgi:hypothetical protein
MSTSSILLNSSYFKIVQISQSNSISFKSADVSACVFHSKHGDKGLEFVEIDGSTRCLEFGGEWGSITESLEA